MIIVSIDFSILFPGICISKDFKTFKWIGLVNTNVTKADRSNYAYINKKYPNISIIETVSRRETNQHYHLTERSKLLNYLELIKTIIQELKKEAIGQDIIISIEGISFGSSGNSLVDISQATGMLKYQLFELLNGEINKFFVFSPMTLKNAIGCKGNANKLEIFNKFKEDPIIPEAKTSDLFLLVNNEDFVIKKEKVISPIMDMVDSYLGILKIYEQLK